MRKAFDFLKHFFTPQEENNFRARAIHLDLLTFYLVVAFVLTFTFKYLNANFQSVLGFATDISAAKLYELTNKAREKNNLPDLAYSEKLAQAAQKKAADMFKKNYWAHYAPDGAAPWDFILTEGYQYEYAGENLAKNFLYSSGVVDAWMNSATHKENILRREYTEIGFGIVNGVLSGEETTLVVQFFGKPSSAPLAKQIPQKTLEETAPVEAAQRFAPAHGSPSVLSFSSLSFGYNLVFIMFLLLVLGLDLYFASKFKIVRVSGKNAAHAMFLVFILVGVFIVTKGAIL